MASRSETAHIVLGGQTYAVAAFTLDQLEAIGDELGAMLAPTLGRNIGAMKRLLAVAIGIPAEELGRLHVTLPELKRAAETLSRVTGLDDLKKERAAEQAAAAAAAK